jgi:DNA polymerase family A
MLLMQLLTLLLLLVTCTCEQRARRTHGYVKTLTGRQRQLPNISSPVPAVRAQAERQAVNSIIQVSYSAYITICTTAMSCTSACGIRLCSTSEVMQ